jgi:membrane dipeptidase
MPFADFHCDTVLKIYEDQCSFSPGEMLFHLDLDRLNKTGFLLQSFAVFCKPEWGQESVLRHTLRQINIAREFIFKDIPMVTTGTLIDTAERGNLSGMLTIEGADFVGDDLFLIDLVHSLGVRLITLTWNQRNSLADGVGLGNFAGGLTRLGRASVKRMQDLKIIVDVSHLSDPGFWDMNTVTTKPFVASHSNCRSLCNHPRNLTDEQIQAIIEHKGLIGINLVPDFIAPDPQAQTLINLARHAAHIADLGGLDNLCLGLDLDGMPRLPAGFNDVQDVIQLAEALGEVGFSEGETQAICCNNLLRFLKNYLE